MENFTRGCRYHHEHPVCSPESLRPNWIYTQADHEVQQRSVARECVIHRRGERRLGLTPKQRVVLIAPDIHSHGHHGTVSVKAVFPPVYHADSENTDTLISHCAAPSSYRPPPLFAGERRWTASYLDYALHRFSSAVALRLLSVGGKLSQMLELVNNISTHPTLSRSRNLLGVQGPLAW